MSGRLDATTVRTTISAGKGRMPAFPHIADVEMEALVTYLMAPAVRAAGRRAAGARRHPASHQDPSSAPERRAGRPMAAGDADAPRSAPYPEGVEQTPQYVINAYGTIGVMMKPPFTKLSRYDLNTGTIKWQVGLGDDARLAAHGITGTGVTQMRSSLIVTSANLVFAPGGDSKLRAYDTRRREAPLDLAAARRHHPRRPLDVSGRRPAGRPGCRLRGYAARRTVADAGRRHAAHRVPRVRAA